MGPESIPEAETCQSIGCKVVTNVGGGKLRADMELDSKIKGFDRHEAGRMEIECPYCADHPILRERCLHCRGKGKVDVGKAE